MPQREEQSVVTLVFWAFQALLGGIASIGVALLWSINGELKNLGQSNAVTGATLVEHSRRLDLHLQKNNEQDKSLYDLDGRVKVLEAKKHR